MVICHYLYRGIKDPALLLPASIRTILRFLLSFLFYVKYLDTCVYEITKQLFLTIYLNMCVNSLFSESLNSVYPLLTPGYSQLPFFSSPFVAGVGKQATPLIFPSELSIPNIHLHIYKDTCEITILI